jgi:carbon storage regulator CsrA
MLVLRRKIGERIIIDGRIEVTVLRVLGGRVRLGVAAPSG